MKLHNPASDIYIWNGDSMDIAITRTTHLAVAAHQDDIEFMAYHGILACYGSDRNHFSGVVTTDGSSSPRSGIYKNFTDAEMVNIRKTEQQKAAFIGEYSSLIQLMYTSAQLKDKRNTSIIDDLVEILKKAQPEIVYTHNLADKHDTHVAVAIRLITAIRRLPKNMRPKKVLGCEVWRGLDWMEDNQKVMLDVSGKQNLAYALTNVFDSQISGGKNYGAGVTGRRRANVTFADARDIDKTTHLTYAMDLTPLIVDDNASIKQFVLEHIRKFNDCVADKISALE